MDLEEESDVAGFLGVSIERRSDGTIKLLQAGLIKRIVEALNIAHHLRPNEILLSLGFSVRIRMVLQ
jgi:hypothetical protein